MKIFIAHTNKTGTEMLNSISYSSVENLFKQIPVIVNTI